MKHEKEISEIRNMINIVESNTFPTNQPDEFYNFAGLSKERTGLSVNIFLDQSQSYKVYNHPLWVYITNGYSDNADYIPISVDDLKVHCNNKDLKLYQSDLNQVLCFILLYKQEIYDIANENYELLDFIDTLKHKQTSQNLISEERKLLTEMAKVSPAQTGLPFTIWIGTNNKEHFVGVKFQPNNSETISSKFPEVSVPDCEVVSNRKFEQWRLKYVIALIRANSQKLIELGKHPEMYENIINSLTKIDNECNPIIEQPEWFKCGESKFGATKVRNQNGKYNFIDSNEKLLSETWFDVANDFTMNKQHIVRAYTILNGQEGFLYLTPVQWKPIG